MRPEPDSRQVLVRVLACGVCRTDLHVADGELTGNKLPLVLGHEIVGDVIACGAAVTRFSPGDRVGVPWLGATCGICNYCTSGRENLCDDARFTGYHLDGGYAECALADERYCFALPAAYSPAEAAPVAVRRFDRLSRAHDGGRRAHDRHLWVRRCRPHRGAGCALPGTAGVCFSRVQATAQDSSLREAWALRGRGIQMHCHPSRSRQRSFSHRSAHWFLRLCARPQKGAPWCAREYT
jgi:hypothetical protein